MRKMFYGVQTFARKSETNSGKGFSRILHYYEEPLYWFLSQTTNKPERLTLLYYEPFLTIFSLYATKTPKVLALLSRHLLKIQKFLPLEKIHQYLAVFKDKLAYFDQDLLSVVEEQIEKLMVIPQFETVLLPWILEKARETCQNQVLETKLTKFRPSAHNG